MPRNRLAYLLFHLRHFRRRCGYELVILGGHGLVGLWLAHAVKPVPRHVAQLAGRIDFKHGAQHHSGIVFAAKHRPVAAYPFFRQRHFDAAEPFIDSFKIQLPEVFPHFLAVGGCPKTRGAF